MRYAIVILIFFSWVIGLNDAAYGQDDASSRQIIISTFDVKSAGKYSYLRDGVQSMLASRLSARKGVEILDQRISKKELGRLENDVRDGKKIPAEITADYLVTGALFALTKGLNIQVVVYPLSLEKDIMRFSTIAEDDASIIPKMDLLVQDIAAKVFGLEKSDSAMKGQEEQLGGTESFVTVHPEVAYKRGIYSGSVVGVGDSMIEVSAQGVKRSTEVSGEMIAMAVGDVDGDGNKEVILLSERELLLFRLFGREVRQVASTKLPRSIKVHAINMVDLDNNGKMEIYLSATRDLVVSSLIMEWDKTSGFTITKQFIPWYIRPINHPTRGLILAGQQRGINRIDFVKKGVFQLTLNSKDKFQSAGEIVLPPSVNLFDFTYADIDGDKKFEIIVIDQREKLRVYDQENGLLWVSSEKYGGNQTYIGPSQGEAVDRNKNTSLTADEDAERDLIFVPGRVEVVDLDVNGRQDIVVVSNADSTLSFFRRLRLYDGGSVVGLTWNGSALAETWRTGKHPGYVADFDFSMKKDMVIGSKEEKGIATLYICQIPTSGSLESLLPGFSHSKLSIYELGFSLKNPKVE